MILILTHIGVSKGPTKNQKDAVITISCTQTRACSPVEARRSLGFRGLGLRGFGSILLLGFRVRGFLVGITSTV